MAGRSDIVISGIQDVFLTGNPQISYFLTRFSRYTKFTTQTLEMPFNGNPVRGQELSCQVSTSAGDMITNMTLKIFVDNEITSNVHDSFIRANIDYIDLYIGGQHIDRLTTDYISMYLKLRSVETDDLNILSRESYNVNSHFSPTIPLYLNLPFYFYKHPHLAIPVCAMYKHGLEVRVKMREPVEFQTAYMPVDYSENLKIKKISLNVDYHHLMEEEKAFFKSRPMEYIITQNQLARKIIKSTDIDKEHSFMCNFKNPVREFMFFLQHDAWNKLTNRSNIYEELDYANMKINNVELFNGNHNDLSSHQFLNKYRSPSDIVEENLIWHRSSNYYNQTFIPLNDILSFDAVRNLNTGYTGSSSVKPSLGWFKTFKVKNGLFYVYPLCIDPNTHEPTGHLNMSRISHQKFTFKFKKPDPNSIYSVWNNLHGSTLSMYAVNYNVLVFNDGLCGLKY